MIVDLKIKLKPDCRALAKMVTTFTIYAKDSYNGALYLEEDPKGEIAVETTWVFKGFTGIGTTAFDVCKKVREYLIDRYIEDTLISTDLKVDI